MSARVTHLRLPAALATARASLRQDRDALMARYDEIDGLLRAAAERAQAGDVDTARDIVQRACDIEFALTGDCEASGPVADALGAPIEKSPASR